MGPFPARLYVLSSLPAPKLVDPLLVGPWLVAYLIILFFPFRVQLFRVLLQQCHLFCRTCLIIRDWEANQHRPELTSSWRGNVGAMLYICVACCRIVNQSYCVHPLPAGQPKC